VTEPLIRCDGCVAHVAASLVATPRADGHEARYCRECHEAYEDWLKVCSIEEGRLNRVLDVFVSDSRARLPLLFVPQDLSPRAAPSGLILG
jgi:hypothetical protein